MIDDILDEMTKMFYPDYMPETITNKEKPTETISHLNIAPHYNSSGKKDYHIIVKTNRSKSDDIKGWIVIDGIEYAVDYFYNLGNCIKGDYIAVERILLSIGFDVRDFEVKDRTEETQWA